MMNSPYIPYSKTSTSLSSYYILNYFISNFPLAYKLLSYVESQNYDSYISDTASNYYSIFSPKKLLKQQAKEYKKLDQKYEIYWCDTEPFNSFSGGCSDIPVTIYSLDTVFPSAFEEKTVHKYPSFHNKYVHGLFKDQVFKNYEINSEYCPPSWICHFAFYEMFGHLFAFLILVLGGILVLLGKNSQIVPEKSKDPIFDTPPPPQNYPPPYSPDPNENIGPYSPYADLQREQSLPN